ncbi:MAG TPA: class I SAM-dependent methyltransferase [Mycobacteriales bacterium]
MEADRWARWVLETRFGGDVGRRDEMLAVLGPVRDRVLDGAGIRPGDTVLDVGCGDGLLGFAALDRCAPDGTVVFSDVSAALLEACRTTADRLGATDRCRFVHTWLPGLAGIADGAADVVVLRSVLLYVRDKPACLRALRRVLRPGGRLSLFEPVNRFGPAATPGRLWGYDVTAVQDLADRVAAVAEADRPPDDPITDYDERDLLAAAEEAGFSELRLAYEARVGADDGFGAGTGTVAQLLATPPNPTAAAPGELLDRALAPVERDRFVAHLAAQPPDGFRVRRAVAYLTAQLVR